MTAETLHPGVVGDVELSLNGKHVKLPVYKGTESECGIDISQLHSKTSYVTLDPGLGNTGSCTSAITHIDGDQGILRHRGIPIEVLAEKSSFLETSHLLIYGKLPTRDELDSFAREISQHYGLPKRAKAIFDGFEEDAHPMAIMASKVVALSTYYPDCLQVDVKNSRLHIVRLIAKFITIAAHIYRKSKQKAFIDADPALGYVENFMRMMFADEAGKYVADPVIVRALDMIFTLHADHGQNCSTSTVRMTGSSQANIYAAIAAGICALWGPWHGGANQAVIEMLETIQQDGGDVRKFIQHVKDRKSGVRLMGFGHRIYKNFDPRAQILKKACDDVLGKLGVHDPCLDLAKKLEKVALEDEYFIERKLYPNVDFYSGIILRALGIPVNSFTVIFAIGRLPGWIAHWKEMLETPGLKIYRPRQIYVGPTLSRYIPIKDRT
ncbi:MAG: citrate synthase [Candidatus Omnitrophica bacterium]|nr:citrate synthase [Candidatus Omnitrophota bacterium]